MKTVLVTGGTRGLGLAITGRLSREGYKVLATGRRISSELERLIGDCDMPGTIEFAELDLSRSNRIHNFVREMTDQHGPLYGLVNNAAIGHEGILSTMHETQIEELIGVNVLGTIVLTKYACRSMLIRREGRIINIASIIGHTGFSGLSVYGATKSAMLGFTRSLARELGRAGVTVNSVSPGYMQTDMTASLVEDKLDSIKRRSPLSRLVDVSEVAGVVVYLLGPESSSITGTDIVVDAGSRA